MGFKCGIVGLPNVGKSTLFNALTKAGIQAENYPFCTIDPNVGVVEVPDKRLQAITRIAVPKKVIPTTMEFVDIAGLVAGASKGEGLGNKFLANIRETDAIAQVVRCFEDDNVVHVDGKVDPESDIDVVETELALADLEAVEKAFLKAEKNSKSGNKEAIARKECFKKLLDQLSEGNPVRALTLNELEKEFAHELQLLTAKPMMYIVNVAEDGFKNNPLLDKVKEIAQKEEAVLVAVCASIESEIAELEDDEKIEFLSEMDLKEPGLDRVVRGGYELLGLQTYFTAGVQEVRAWTVKIGATAPESAGVIHTDFEKGFIRAEVMSYKDYVECKGEQGAKEAGKWRLEGKEYITQDGDIMHFRFNV